MAFLGSTTHQELLDREEQLYDDMLAKWPREWFAIVDGKLYHASARADVFAALVNDGVAPADVIVQFLGRRAPYLVL